MARKNDFIEMAVTGLEINPVNKAPIVILKDPDKKLNLPIRVGILGVMAIAIELQGIKMARPMTHDLLKNVLREAGGSVEFVEITALKGSTYYALIYLNIAGRQITIDSRPSDAIALALRTKSPIYVARAVIEASRYLQQAKEGKRPDFSNASKEKWTEILEKMSPQDFKYEM